MKYLVTLLCGCASLRLFLFLGAYLWCSVVIALVFLTLIGLVTCDLLMIQCCQSLCPRSGFGRRGTFLALDSSSR